MLLHIRTKNETHLTSLLEMLKFSAADWNEIIRELDVIHHAVFKAFQHGDRNSTITSLRKIQESCGHLGLTFSSSYVDRIVNLVMGMVTFPEMRDSINEFVSQLGEGKIQREMASKNNENFGPKEFENEIDILKRRIDDELQGRDFLLLSKNGHPIFMDHSNLEIPFLQNFLRLPKTLKRLENA